MATDYDDPKPSSEEIDADSLEGLRAAEEESTQIDDNDDGSITEVMDIPIVDLDEDEYTGSIQPATDEEFTCGRCFLIQDRSRIGQVLDDGTIICADCV